MQINISIPDIEKNRFLEEKDIVIIDDIKLGNKKDVFIAFGKKFIINKVNRDKKSKKWIHQVKRE